LPTPSANARSGATAQPLPLERSTIDDRNREELMRALHATRDALERSLADKEAEVQRAITASADEVAQLHATIDSLRAVLERAEGEREKAVADAVQQAATEIKDLRAAVEALREGLERAEAERDGAIQRAILALSEENVQLKRAAGALRDAMEREHAAHADRELALERQYQSALAQLQTTVRDLRAQLEQRDEG